MTNASVALIQQFSPDDEQMDARSMYRREINISSRIVHTWLNLFARLYSQQNLKMMHVVGLKNVTTLNAILNNNRTATVLSIL